jgi:hypothetical protein
MKSLVKATVLAAMLLAGVSLFGAQISVGIRIGPPPPPRVVRVLPARPSTEFIWVDGYWYPVGRRYRWHEGYWTRPPYSGARWVSPHHDGDEFFEGYWEGDRGRMEHDHRWDRDHDRDFHERGRDREQDRDREHDRDHDR